MKNSVKLNFFIRLLIQIIIITAIFLLGKFVISFSHLEVSQDANMRSASSKESSIVQIVKTGTVIEGEKIGDWYKAKVNSKEGFISASVVKKTGISNWIVVLICIIIYMIIFKKMKQTQCPYCKRYFVKQIFNSEVLDEQHGSRIDKEEDPFYNKKHEQVGTVERKVHINTTTESLRFTFRCKKCGYEWYKYGKNTYDS